MLNIVFNGLSLADNLFLGIHRYELELLKCLDSLCNDNDIHIAVALPEGVKSQVSFENIEMLRVGPYKESRLGRIVWLQKTLPHFLVDNRCIGVDLTWGLPRRGFDFISIHDCTCEVFPENYPGLRGVYTRLSHMLRVHSILDNTNAKILTLSIASRDEICRRYSVGTDRFEIVPCGWEHMEDIEADAVIFDRINLESTDEYFFSLGSKYPHKNLSWIAQAAECNPELIFVVTGTNSFLRDAGINGLNKPNIIQTGYVSDGEMKALMGNAKALIQPSRCEGFGLPPLEALSMGVPAIVSNTSCFPEIYGQYVFYLDPDNPKFDFSRLDREILPNPENLLSKYSWQSAAVSLYSVLKKHTGDDLHD